MQDGPGRQKLVQLPQPALEALLDSDDLKVASENSAIAAVTFWLFWLEQQIRSEKLTKEQKRRLAYKLRLLRATPWYLTGALGEKGHWLHDGLSNGQRLMLTAGVHSKVGWADMERADIDAFSAKLFGCGASPAVSWSKPCRPASTITNAEMLWTVTLSELWDKMVQDEAGIEGPHFFYNGTEWGSMVGLEPCEGAADIEGPSRWTVVAYINHNCPNEPVCFTGILEMVGAKEADTNIVELKAEVICVPSTHWGVGNLCGCSFSSLADATNKLRTFIHSDGKLHVTAMITSVH